METSALSFFSLFFFFTLTTSQNCSPSSCGPSEPLVRFPFHLINRQPSRCGYPELGFGLFCNNENQTILNLPSGEVIVRSISYAEQIISIDPQFCIPNRINQFSILGTAFLSSFFWSFTFYNCSSPNTGIPEVVRCLSNRNYTVLALPTYYGRQDAMPSICRNVSTIMIPVRRYGDFSRQLELEWFLPGCSACENDGGTCENDPSTNIVCSRRPSRGVPTAAKYGISLGLGIPGLLCLIGAVYFAKKRVQTYNQTRNQTIDISSITITRFTPRPALLMGLDGPTIESYPKIVLGDSGRLPKANHGTCPICLSDYRPKEELRTIPDCDHYFHADCIDEWLRVNATCPLCRNTPENMVVASCSASASNSSQATAASP